MSAPERVVTPEVLRALTLDTEPWLSCDDCFRLMDQYVERRLVEPAYDDLAMSTHLAACSACADEVGSLQDLLLGEESSGEPGLD
jgi:prophage antirepressor-like protein